jgi:tRNA modification GTPase
MKTIVAPITPLIISSVITLRISGYETHKVFKFLRHFSGEPVKDIEPNKVYVGQFVDNNKIIDSVVFYFFKSPKSYTGEDVLEISFHGNPLIVKKALYLMYSVGILPAEPGEFTKRAFLNSKLDLTQAESVADLINAKSEADLFFSFKALNGGIKNKIIELKNLLIDASSIIEAFVDFPDDNLPESSLNNLIDILKKSKDKIEYLIKSYDLSKVTKKTLSLALVGKPNVGKSSLLNFLLNKDRAIVSDIPGTTRDYIEDLIYISGYPVKLIDTAGIRDSNNEVEKLGVSRSIDLIDTADFVLILLDLSMPIDEEDFKILNLTQNKNRLVIGNKSDKKITEFNYNCDLEVSVKYKTNMDKLIRLLESKLIKIDSDIYNFDVVISERHKILLENTLQSVNEILKNFNIMTFDIISIEIGSALRNLGEITGDTYMEEILGNIFNKFCIGK